MSKKFEEMLKDKRIQSVEYKSIPLSELENMISINEVLGLKDDDKDRNDGLLPIERLENLGKKVLRKNGLKPNETDEIVVMVGSPSNDPMEGTMFGSPRKDMSGLEKHYINLNDITDYNSLWELTKSGWDNEDEILVPYLIVDGYGVRWDDHQLRRDMKIYTWTEENHQKYMLVVMSGNKLHNLGGTIFGVNETIKSPPKVGRNQQCPCGSGKKFKKCCLN